MNTTNVRKRSVFTPQEQLFQQDGSIPVVNDQNPNPVTTIEPEIIVPKPLNEVPLNLENNPYVVVSKDIPSRFLPYPEGSEIRYRPYYYGEVKNYSQSLGLSIKDKFLFMLSGVETEGFDKLDMTLSDFMYVGLLRRMSALGDSDIIISFVCNRCGNIVEHRSKCSEVDIEYLNVPKLPISVNLLNGTELIFSPMTVRGYLELNSIDKGEDDLAFLAKCCVNLPYEEVYKVMTHITDYQDVELLDKIDELLYHSVKPIQVKCKHKELVLSKVEEIDIDKLREMATKDINGFVELCNKHYPDFKYMEGTTQLSSYVDYIAEKMGIIKYNICDRVNMVEIDSGDVLISPFRKHKEPVENRIRFG